MLAKPGDLAAILTNLEPRDVLFIDEIHRLSPRWEEVLYPALEDFALDLVLGEGPAGADGADRLQRSRWWGDDAAGASDDSAAGPVRDSDAAGVLLRRGAVRDRRAGARLMGLTADPEGCREIARRARGTPRIAGRLLRRVADFALVEAGGRISRELADRALTRLGVDNLGLDGADRRYLSLWAENYGGGPVGVETIAAALSEPRDCDRGGDRALPFAAGADPADPRGRMLGAQGLAASGAGGAKVAGQADLFGS